MTAVESERRMTAVDQVERDNAVSLAAVRHAAWARAEAARWMHPCSLPGDDTDPTPPFGMVRPVLRRVDGGQS